MPAAPWDSEAGQLDRYLEHLTGRHGADVEFVVLYGSRARGDHMPGSDFDLMIGVRRAAEGSFIDRLRAFVDLDCPLVEPLVYTLEEVQQMFRSGHMTLLESLKDGKPLLDRGCWGALLERFRQIERGGWVWKTSDETWHWLEETPHALAQVDLGFLMASP